MDIYYYMKKINNSTEIPAHLFERTLNLTNISTTPIVKKQITQMFKKTLNVSCSNGTVLSSNNNQTMNFTEYDDAE